MSLLKEWEEIAYVERTQEAADAFWEVYLKKEQKVYMYILENSDIVIKGKFKELADKFSMELKEFAGFMSGINTSLKNLLDVDSLIETSDVILELDFEKLFYNMLDAEAEWLYTLPQWDEILTVEKRTQITKDYNRSRTIVNENKVGRNDPCPCGSGKKYKKCCGRNE